MRTWREFAKGAKSISVHQGDGQIKLVPWKNEGVLEISYGSRTVLARFPTRLPMLTLAQLLLRLADID